MENVEKICVNQSLVGEFKYDKEMNYYFLAVSPDLRGPASNLLNGTPSDGVVGKKENFLHIKMYKNKPLLLVNE